MSSAVINLGNMCWRQHEHYFKIACCKNWAGPAAHAKFIFTFKVVQYKSASWPTATTRVLTAQDCYGMGGASRQHLLQLSENGNCRKERLSNFTPGKVNRFVTLEKISFQTGEKVTNCNSSCTAWPTFEILSDFWKTLQPTLFSS